jgi:predicted NACHT family NTPase
MLSRVFLIEIAQQYELSDKEQEVFLEKFGTDKSDHAIAQELYISDGAFRDRMSRVYRKFSIKGKGPVTSDLLFRFLSKEYQKSKPSGSPRSDSSEDDLDELVQRVRQQRHAKIQDQCGTMQMLDISQAIGISDIYTDVNVLEEITSQLWREISDLLQGFNPESDDFDRPGLGRVLQSRVPGLDAVSRYSKLMVLGKPGSGKTTFLQWVAIKCDLGDFQSDLAPIFIRLRNFAEDTKRKVSSFRLWNYISEEFVSCGIADKSVIERILTQGKALILLDGLDEVSDEDGDEVVRQIRRFTGKYFKNQFIITCRIAAQQYRFQGFTDVEVADFKKEQVEAFAKKWFVAVARNNWEEGEATAKRFIKKLNQPVNQRIRELAVTPILLNLTCLVFQAKGEFPSKRSKLYEQGLDILLVRWDESRGIQRDEVYRSLSLERKIELLSQIAAITFEKSNYFFEQGEVERYIASYLRTLPNAQKDRTSLQHNSKTLLKSIEAQHGLLVERAREIYSFSHLTFQEYFTAKYFVDSSCSQVLGNLLSHITEKRWREVFLLTSGMLQNGDHLLWSMKEQIDELIASDEKLQKFLKWVNQKAFSIQVSYKPAAVRAFYLALGRSINHDFALNLNHDISLDHVFDHDLAHNLDHDLAYDIYSTSYVDRDLSLDYDLAHARDLSHHLAHDLAPELKRILQQLQAQIDKLGKDWVTNVFDYWWQANGKAWTEQLRAVMLKYRNMGHDWQLSEQQKELLRQYYDANKLLVDCLNSGCEVTPAVRSQIEDTLLLPIAEIEKRRQQS